MMLRKEEVSLEKICASKIFHFGTLSFTHAGIRTASQYAIQCAKEAGALISFDPIAILLISANSRCVEPPFAIVRTYCF